MEKIEDTIDGIMPLDEDAMEFARKRHDSLTKPAGSLGVLEELSIKVAGITRNPAKRMRDKVIITMAADHGVTDEGVSAYPKEVTAQMVHNFLSGGAGINVLARHVGARVVVVDMGVSVEIGRFPELVKKKIGYGTKNIARGPAMSYEDAIISIETGIDVFEEEMKRGIDIIGTGDMGIGNTTASSAIAAVITGESVERVTGRGTGINDIKDKVRVIEKALEINDPDPNDPIDLLSKVGGFEIGGLVGVILAGAKNCVPTIIDGFISGASALIATELAEDAKDYIIASHLSAENGHEVMLKYMGLSPILNLNLRLGEGTGAALGISIVEASMEILNEMMTFGEAKVSREI